MCWGDQTWCVFLSAILSLVQAYNNDCPKPLGLMSGEIADWQLGASSVSSDPGCHIKYARLHLRNGLAWCAGYSDRGQWLLVDLGVTAEISGIMTQGRGDKRQWVKSYFVSYSQDAYKWDTVKDVYGDDKMFSGNSDSHSVMVRWLDEPFSARFLRIHVLGWHKWPSLRLELIGCQECNKLLTEPGLVKVKASSHSNWKRRHSCEPEESNLRSARAWCARRHDSHQWLEWDLGPPKLVTGVVTKGRGDSRRKQWVSSYTLSYSNDSVIWFYYKDGNHLDPKQLFGGNMDKHTERRHYLNEPVVARYIRIHPVEWHSQIAMRAGLLGCSLTDDCGPGFLRVNKRAVCVENMAYKRVTWVNDKRSAWKDWKYGHSGFAVDGLMDTTLPHCAILDNYYVDSPTFMVDLGTRREVQGVMILTWQGKGQDQNNMYRDYVYNLDKLVVYLDNKPKVEDIPKSGSHKCDIISRQNDTLFQPMLHFQCPKVRKARYVYINAQGVSHRWTRLYTAILCEVMVYGP